MCAEPAAAEAEQADLRSVTRRTVDPHPVQVRPGLWSLPVEIPIAALGVVNVYAFEHSDRCVTLVDSGWDSDESEASLTEGLRQIGRTPDDVARVIVTHAHPDHLGLAHRLRDRTGCPITVHEREAARLAGPPSMPVRFRAAARERLPRWGVPAEATADLVSAAAPSSDASWTVPVQAATDGAALDVPGWDLRVLWTPGHTAGHQCLYEAGHRLLFTGDHVLPRITPGIGAHPGEQDDALGNFLQSLQAVAGFDVAEVMPGHEYRFTDLPGRVAALQHHHQDRLSEIEEAVRADPGCTAWSVTRRITWSRPLHRFGGPMIRGAVAETVAHLVHLDRRGRLRCELDASGPAPAERWYPC